MSSMFEEYAEKLGRPKEYFEQLYQQFLAELKKFHPEEDEEKLKIKAKFLVYRQVKAELRSPAIAFEGIVIGYSDLRDITAAQRNQALEMYRLDPIKAIQEGWTDEHGTPLDNRPTLPNGRENPFYGKPLQPVFVRESFIIGKHYGKDEAMRLIIVQQIGERARMKPPLFKYVTFRANERSVTPNRIIARAGSPTRFDVLPKQVDIASLLRDAPENFKVPMLADLMQWHNAHADDRFRVCVIEGDVVQVRNEPSSIGNKMIVIEDESIMGIENEGITVWVPGDFELDFGPGSHVFVVGRTAVGPGWNPETRSLDSNIQRVMVNAFGVFPEFVVPAGVVTPVEADFAITE